MLIKKNHWTMFWYYLHLLPSGLWCLSSGLDPLPSALFVTNSWQRSGCSSVCRRFSVRDRDLVLLGGGAVVVVAGVVVVAVAAVIHCALAFCIVSIMLWIIGSLIPWPGFGWYRNSTSTCTVSFEYGCCPLIIMYG